MKIGQAATRAGVNIDTLRYYERRGLLAEPQRRPSGYREYPEETVPIIRFIKRAKNLGFTLNKIEELISLRDGGDGRRTSPLRLPSPPSRRLMSSSISFSVKPRSWALLMKRMMGTVYSGYSRYPDGRRCGSASSPLR